ncbi:MAG: hypothetical protein HY303_06895 [Candidatus Wallbacteria bacterium]|nr:hypothetical protein [Candidatus Wallbacteria bacterium]
MNPSQVAPRIVPHKSRTVSLLATLALLSLATAAGAQHANSQTSVSQATSVSEHLTHEPTSGAEPAPSSGGASGTARLGHERFGSSEVELGEDESRAEAVAPSMPVDDCSWTFAGSARMAVKLRTQSDGTNYARFNDGAPIDVSQWFQLVCPFQSRVPSQVPRASAIQGLETIVVTLHGFLMAAGFEADHDIHCEIAASPQWNQDHVVVEVPPGPDYCDARKTMWGLVKADMGAANADTTGTKWVMHHPAEVLVTGYVFLDSPHASAGTEYCKENGGRGMQNPPGAASQVRGLWELHPVLSAKALGGQK